MKARQHTMTMTITAESLSFFDIGMDKVENNSGVSDRCGVIDLICLFYAEYRRRGIFL